MLLGGISANLVLGWFNLLPIPPLDGGHILQCLLPYRMASSLDRIGKTGFIILVVLLACGALNYVLMPILNLSFKAMLSLAGI